MVSFSDYESRNAIENECNFLDRDIPQTIYSGIHNAAQKWPHRPAFSFQMESKESCKAKTLNWREVHNQSVQLANFFRSEGLTERDAVAYILPNCNEAVLTYLAGMISGIVVPINPLLEADSIASILNATNAKIVVTLGKLPKIDIAERVSKAVQNTPTVKTVIEVDLVQYLPLLKKTAVKVLSKQSVQYKDIKQISFNDALTSQPPTLNFEDIKNDRVVASFHTGGTTGTPKVVDHMQTGVLYIGWLGGTFLLNNKSVAICPLPLFHVFGSHGMVCSAIISGAHVVLPTAAGFRGDGVLDNFWKLIERWKVTFILAVPTAMSALMERPINADVSSVELLLSGSAPLPVDVFNRFEKTTGIEVVEGYGLTEATAVLTGNPIGGMKKIGSVGIPFPYSDVQIRTSGNGHTALAQVGEVGEICAKGPGICDTQIYRNASDNDSVYTDDGYLRTGDRGYVDEDGYIWITGREKDLIIRGGHNIDPSIIEEALDSHSDVELVAAIGQPDKHAGETPCAYVSLQKGSKTTATSLIEYAKSKISEQAAWPKHIEILEDLPLTPVGKISKLDLRKIAIQRVFNETLDANGIEAHVTKIEDDKQKGLVALVSTQSQDQQERVASVLNGFIYGWK